MAPTSPLVTVVIPCHDSLRWLPHALEALVGRHREADAEPGAHRPVGLVHGWDDVVHADGTPTGRVEAHMAEGEAWGARVTENPVRMSGTLVPRAVFEELGGFEVNRDRFPVDVEDWDLWIRIADRHRLAAVRDVPYHYRRHDQDSSTGWPFGPRPRPGWR